jgi:plastocyanin
MMRGTWFVTLALAAAATACGNNSYGSGGSGCTSSTTKVCALDNVFSPTTLTVTAGTTVTWQNGGGNTHSVTSDTSEPFNTDIGSNATTSHQFNTPGTYTYHCRFHGTPTTGMHATIMVN